MRLWQPASSRTWRLSRRAAIAALIVCGTVLVPASRAHAQVDAGTLVDSATQAPLVKTRVRLEALRDGKWTVIDSARTDAHGGFQLVVPTLGTYRVAFGQSPRLGASPADSFASADSVVEREYLVPLTSLAQERPFYAWEVDEPAAAARSSGPRPSYPEVLRRLGIDGSTTLRFTVGPGGHVLASSIQVVTGTSPDFIDAIRSYLKRASYKPARIGGITVAQEADQSFNFTINQSRVDGSQFDH